MKKGIFLFTVVLILVLTSCNNDVPDKKTSKREELSVIDKDQMGSADLPNLETEQKLFNESLSGKLYFVPTGESLDGFDLYQRKWVREAGICMPTLQHYDFTYNNYVFFYIEFGCQGSHYINVNDEFISIETAILSKILVYDSFKDSSFGDLRAAYFAIDVEEHQTQFINYYPNLDVVGTFVVRFGDYSIYNVGEENTCVYIQCGTFEQIYPDRTYLNDNLNYVAIGNDEILSIKELYDSSKLYQENIYYLLSKPSDYNFKILEVREWPTN